MELEEDYKRVNQYASPEVTRHTYTESTGSSLDQMLKKAQYAYHFRGEETGLYHPSQSNVVKLKNSGDIDVFVENNVGMNINKRLETISFMANKMKQNLHESKRWLTGDDTSYIKGNQLTKVVGNVTLDGQGHLTVEIDKDIFVHSTNVTVNIDRDAIINIDRNANINVAGNATAKIGQHAKIDVDRDLVVRSKGNIDMEATGYLRIDGSQLFIGQVARR